jgi:hypothetical protein
MTRLFWGIAAAAPAAACAGHIAGGEEEGPGAVMPAGPEPGPGDFAGQGRLDPGAGPGAPGGASASAPAIPGATAAGPGACQPGPGAGPGPAPGPGPGPAPPPGQVRRLNHFELDSTIRDLLGDPTRASSGFPPDDRVFGFDTVASGLTVYPVLAEKYLTTVEAISERATANLPRLLACDPARAGEEACVRAFVASFGRRAWRRPLEPAESAALWGTYARGRAAGDLRLGVQTLLQRLLLSPHFLYRLEPSRAGEPAGRARLSPWEIASRLSYALWGTMPDEALFAAAESGALAQDAEIARQARRLLADPRARETAVRFWDQALALHEIDQAVKDDKAYPAFTGEVRGLLRQSARKQIEHVVFGGGDLGALLTAPEGHVNDKIAPLFGAASASPRDLVRVELDPAQRAGIVTHPLVLAMTAKAAATSPVRRGVYVRERLLGMDLPPPLPDVNTNLPTPRPDATTRERFAEHARNPGCAACHTLIDPIGFGLEAYDPVGQWRPTEKGRPIDARGEIVNADVAGPFDGAVELARKLARSGQARAFAVTQLFRYVFGRGETDEDACTLAQAGAAFAARGHKLGDLPLALVDTEAFRHRLAGGGAP